jgi:hypothetical protein
MYEADLFSERDELVLTDERIQMRCRLDEVLIFANKRATESFLVISCFLCNSHTMEYCQL